MGLGSSSSACSSSVHHYRKKRQAKILMHIHMHAQKEHVGDCSLSIQISQILPGQQACDRRSTFRPAAWEQAALKADAHWRMLYINQRLTVAKFEGKMEKENVTKWVNILDLFSFIYILLIFTPQISNPKWFCGNIFTANTLVFCIYPKGGLQNIQE